MALPRFSPVVNTMVSAAQKAAKRLLRDFGEVENLQVSVKGPSDFVSQADLRAEETLRAELSKGRPDHGFLMEESGGSGPEEWKFRFVVDPLDGTTGWARRRRSSQASSTAPRRMSCSWARRAWAHS
jgi:myo-inositol-1(or 4)-monophosphatase